MPSRVRLTVRPASISDRLPRYPAAPHLATQPKQHSPQFLYRTLTRQHTDTPKPSPHPLHGVVHAHTCPHIPQPNSCTPSLPTRACQCLVQPGELHLKPTNIPSHPTHLNHTAPKRAAQQQHLPLRIILLPVYNTGNTSQAKSWRALCTHDQSITHMYDHHVQYCTPSCPSLHSVDYRPCRRAYMRHTHAFFPFPCNRLGNRCRVSLLGAPGPIAFPLYRAWSRKPTRGTLTHACSAA